MWTKKEMKTWESNDIKQWLQEIDDTYFELSFVGKKDADCMFHWGLEILKERDEDIPSDS